MSRFSFYAICICLVGLGSLLPSATASPESRQRDSYSPSGKPLPRGNLPNWRRVYANGFNQELPIGSFSGCDSHTRRCSGLRGTAEFDRLWAYPDGWPDTSDNGRYMPSEVMSEHDGTLDLYLHTERGVPQVAAPVPIIQGAPGRLGGLRYARYSIRFRADPLPCYKAAWLLWPDSERWPEDGEINFPEGSLDEEISAFSHRQGGDSDHDQDAFDTGAGYGSWHTATTEWTARALRFYLDGTLIGETTRRIPSTPMHWVLQTETGLDGCVPANRTAGHVRIDWATVYRPS
jgi:hypothetical protein